MLALSTHDFGGFHRGVDECQGLGHGALPPSSGKFYKHGTSSTAKKLETVCPKVW
jgi:hypothetical protein